MSLQPARLVAVTALTGGVWQLQLQAPDAFHFHAGQYLNLHWQHQDIPLSIASAPAALPSLLLHCKTLDNPAGAALQALLDTWHAGTAPLQLSISAAAGDIQIRHATDAPLLLIAAGTGLAQALAIIDALATLGQQAQVQLYWHVASRAALYLHTDLQARAAAHSWFQYHPQIGSLSRQGASALDWLRQAALACTDADVILSGSPDFVYALTDALCDLQLAPRSLRADAFSYAPRPARDTR